MMFLALLGCYGGDLESERAASGNLIDLRNDSTGKVELELVSVQSGEGANSSELVFLYRLIGLEPSDLPPGARIILTIVDGEGNTVVVSDALPLDTSMNAQTDADQQGEIIVSVPEGVDNVSAVATITTPEELPQNPGELANLEENQPQGVLLDIPLHNNLRPTDLTSVTDFSLEFVEDSYSTETTGQRRLHRFGVRAYDQECVSIRGLSSDLGSFFSIAENGIHDVESPVTFDSRDNRVKVYMVLDASSSITLDAAAEGSVRAAVENVVSQMPDDYELDYRQFNGEVTRLASHLDYQSDASESGTAFYYAIDTVLDDIEAQGNNNDYHVIVAFTDGLDLASRNYYGTGYTHESVKQYVRNRITTFRNAEGPRYGDGLEVHAISMGSIAESDKVNLYALAQAGGGSYYHAVDKSELDVTFGYLTSRVLATYHLEYSSQQLLQDNELTLKLEIGNLQREIEIRAAGGLDVQNSPHRCRTQN